MDLVNETPYIGDLQKEFYRTMLVERKEKILDYSLQKLQSRRMKHTHEAR